MIILDFSKAFDRVPHRRLLKKIHHYGIRGNTHKWIESFLFNGSQQVVAEGKTSETVLAISGVLQGSVLGPLLFLMFINDLPENLTSDTRLFADDAIVYRQKTKILENDLAKLAEWEQLWRMEFYPQKCSYLKISRSRKPTTYKYIPKRVTLAEGTSTKYLGVDIQSNLAWNNHNDRVA